MSVVNGGSGLSTNQYRAAIDSVGDSFQDAETDLFKIFDKKDATETEIMKAQHKYQQAQLRLQSLQEVIRNAFQTMREIVRNGMAIR